VRFVAVAAGLPVAAAVLWTLVRSRLGGLVVAAPRQDRWHTRATPLLGGVGIFAGFLAAIGAALASGATPANKELLGIVGGCAVLFVAGLADDIRSLGPLVKLGAQVLAACCVLAGGLSLQMIGNDVLADLVAVLWLVGMTNAFNLLDNMDGLAVTLAGIAAAFFAVDALTVHPNHTALVLALALVVACLAFLPFNLRPRGNAAVFMGDSGSQVLGFTLAALGLASSWKVAGTTVATLVLPILVLAVPILDTTLVTIVRMLDGRPVYRGGRDHTSHRLVYHGLSEKHAVVLLAIISAALGTTSLAYDVLGDARITLIGVLLTFALLVQFGSLLSDVDRGPDLAPVVERSWLRTFVANPRRLIESLVDFALISASFLAAYYIRLKSSGTPYDRHIFLISLPVVLFARYATFIPFGLYRGVWRYAGARDAASVIGAVVTSEVVAFAFLAATQVWGGFPRSIFVIDAVICTVLIGASRFWERGAARALSVVVGRRTRHRTLIVGAGRAGRSLLRELRETPGEHVVGFVDDDARLRGRRLQGVPVLGGAHELERVLSSTDPETVLVTIPDAPRERLDLVVEGCARAQVPCRFVRRETDLDPRVVLGAASK
jgi:UDP-GlcNAc:undecaprenyl-phosphate/decaprenyl-phosphate GlcNAc-1-phosphate transferase